MTDLTSADYSRHFDEPLPLLRRLIGWGLALVTFLIAVTLAHMMPRLPDPCDSDDAHIEISMRGVWPDKMLITKPVSPGAVILGLCSFGSGPNYSAR